MENKLEIIFKNQKQFFEILDDEIHVDLNTAKHKIKYNIQLEDIKSNWHIENGSLGKKTIALYASLFFNVFLILCLIATANNTTPPFAVKMLCFLLLFPFVFMLTKTTDTYEEKHIGSSKLFYFIYTKKNSLEVDQFIELVYKKQNDFFRRKYFKIDPVLPYTVQYDGYIWLYTNKHIDENEFETIKENLDRYFNFNPSSII